MAMRLPATPRSMPWTGCLVALGLGLRLFHYLRNPSMWHDEAALVLNILAKRFSELLGPLSFAEAAPPLFLWIEKAVTLILGDGTYALRFVPFLASCAALLLMVPIARRLLHPRAVPAALLLFACSDHLLWHACEAKPYAVDVLAATTLIALACTLPSEPVLNNLQLILYILLSPVLIFLVYPGCFLCGGLLVYLLPAVWRARRLRTWLGYALLLFTILGCFGLLLAGPVHAQRCSAMTECWKDSFPPWDRPWKVPLWTVASSLEVFRYCCEPLGQLLAIPAAVGAWGFWQRGQRSLLVLLILPIALALLAAFLGAYPFGGARVVVYATPAIVLLSAEGIVRCTRLAEQERDSTARNKRLLWLMLLRCGAVALVLAPLGLAVLRVVFPWPRADCDTAASYVLAHRRPGEKVAGNHWEYAYYFRHLGSDFNLLTGREPVFEGRLWLVATAGTREDRLATLRHLPPRDWQTLEQRDFSRTTVFLLSRQRVKRPQAN